MQPMSVGLFEQLVFSKPYFDHDGLIVAIKDNRPVGFVHAGFGPDENEAACSTDMGTTYLLMLHSDHSDPTLADELLARSEGYLQDRGTKVIYAGGIRPLNAFYLGLYGGSELPGVLATDTIFLDAVRRNNYREIDQVLVLQRDLAQFRAVISWEQRRLRRTAVLNERYAPPSTTWWEACTTGAYERLEFSLQNAPQGPPLASVGFWDIEPLSTGWGAATAGMFDLHVAPEARRQGLATFLLGEAFCRLRDRGIVLVEAQTMRGNTPALAMYQKLGFQTVDSGYVYRKGE
jgi:ribosomal protein S18 acetylase RimI-like enzyme